MRTFMKIAWRNIIRNKRRSLITVSAVGFGLGALIFVWSFVEGAHSQMIENYTSYLTGHIQVHAKGFAQKQKLETNIPDYQDLLTKIRHIDGVTAAAPRIRAVGLASSAAASSGVAIYGVDVPSEKVIGKLAARIKPGRFLSDNSATEIVIGKTTAENLDVSVGDKMVVMSQALDGSIASAAFTVCGLFDTGASEIDSGLAMISHEAAADLFVMNGATSEVAIKVAGGHFTSTAKHIAGVLNRSDLEVLTWQQVTPMLEQWIEFDNGFTWVIVVIVMIVVAIGILNTVLMGVLERTREFGVLLALGTKESQILAMVGWESLFLGVIGSVVGIFIGLVFSYYFGHQGVNLTIFTTALNTFYMDPLIYPKVNWAHLMISTELVLLTSIAVSIYPAWHAAKLKPMDAMRSL
jgi:putative ABC transport system permease protein